MNCWDTVEISSKFLWNFDGVSNMLRNFIEISMKFRWDDIFVWWKFDVCFIHFIYLIWQSSAIGTHDGHILPLLHVQHWFHNGSARRRGHNNVLWLLSDATAATTDPHVVLAEQTGREKPRSAPKRAHITRFSSPEYAQTSTHHWVCFPCIRDFSMLKIPRSAPKRAHITGFVCHACEPTAWLHLQTETPASPTARPRLRPPILL
jgi:hypothetical protein